MHVDAKGYYEVREGLTVGGDVMVSFSSTPGHYYNLEVSTEAGGSWTTVVANEQVRALDILETYMTHNLGKVSSPAPPVFFAGKDTSLAEPSPSLGEHSGEILAELGFPEEEIQALLTAGKLAQHG